MAEGSEHSLSRRDAILQWMLNVQKATSSENTEESDRGLTFNPDTTHTSTHGSYQTITSPLHHHHSSSGVTTTTPLALPTPSTHTHRHHHHPHTSHTLTPSQSSSPSSSQKFPNNPPSNLHPTVHMEPTPIANISKDPQPLLTQQQQQSTMTNVSSLPSEWHHHQLPTTSHVESQITRMEVSVSPPDVTTATPSMRSLKQRKSTSPLPDPMQDIQLPSFDPPRMASFDLSFHSPKRPKPLIRRYDTFTGIHSSPVGHKLTGSHSHVTRQLSGSHSNVDQQQSPSSNLIRTSLSASHLEQLVGPKSAPVSPNLTRKSPNIASDSDSTLISASSQLLSRPPPLSSRDDGQHLGGLLLSSCSGSRKSYSQSDIRHLDVVAMDQQYEDDDATHSRPDSPVSSLAPNVGGDSIPSDSSSLVGDNEGAKFNFGSDFGSHDEEEHGLQSPVMHVQRRLSPAFVEESQKIETGNFDSVGFRDPALSREPGLTSMNVGEQTGLTRLNRESELDTSNREPMCTLMELDTCEEQTGLTTSCPPRETCLTGMSKTGNTTEEELLDILKKWHREGKGDTEDLLYAMRLTGHRDSADRLQLKEDLASLRTEEKHSEGLIPSSEDQPISSPPAAPLPSSTLSHSTQLIRQRQLTRSPPSPATPLSPQATPTSALTTSSSSRLFRQRSGSLGVESIISRKRLANFDRSQMFSFDTSNEERLIQPQHQPRFLKRSPPSSPGHPPALLLSPPSQPHPPHPHTHTLPHLHRRSSSDIITTKPSLEPSKSHDTHPPTKLSHTFQNVLSFPQSSKYMFFPRRSSSPLGLSTSTATSSSPVLQGTLNKAPPPPLAHKTSPVQAGLTSTQLDSLPESHPLNVSRSPPPAPPVSSSSVQATTGGIVALVEQMKLESVGLSRKRQPSGVSRTSTSLSFPPVRKQSINRQDSGIGTLSEPSVKY